MEPVKGGSLLEARDLVKNHREPLFRPLTFSLAPGEGVGIVGPNGCGKTTLLDIIAGIQKPDSGTVKLSGEVGYCMQNDGFMTSMTCRDTLLMEAAICGLRGKTASARVRLCAEICGVTSYMRKRVYQCSAGMRTRLSLAAALIPGPDVLLLDETFSALDQTSRGDVKRLLLEETRKGACLLLVSHNKDDFSGLCARLLRLPESEAEPL
ncbi:MAG: ATP-binding cassette domain-containing protein [Clostridiales bacterium]|jgi:ABC-type multidrug transport system ATPase subunit|nr:ATP-binding cassette domain-containing protein [Clostridiales bacterium]